MICDLTSPNSILQNHPRLINNNGRPSKDNPLFNHSENKTVLGIGGGGGGKGMNYFYAYGIRNSFGLAFDPLTGHL